MDDDKANKWLMVLIGAIVIFMAIMLLAWELALSDNHSNPRVFDAIIGEPTPMCAHCIDMVYAGLLDGGRGYHVYPVGYPELSQVYSLREDYLAWGNQRFLVLDVTIERLLLMLEEK